MANSPIEPTPESLSPQYSASEWFLITDNFDLLRFVQNGVHLLRDDVQQIGEVFWNNLFGAFSTASAPQIFAHVIAKRSMANRKAPFGEIQSQVPHVLSTYLTNESLRNLAEHSLRQSLVATWTSLEVLASDLFVELVNRSPTLGQRILEDHRGQKLFQYNLKSLVSALQAHKFDLSEQMGSFLARQHPIDDVEAMQVAFGILFPDGDKLRELLHDDQLWRVHKVRNLIVHRGAIVDEVFRQTSGMDAPLGETVHVKPSTLQQFMIFAGQLGLELLKNAQSLRDATEMAK